MYRIYKITIEYSRQDFRGRLYAPDFDSALQFQTALTPELIASSDDAAKIAEEWKKAKEDYKYIEKCANCQCWRGSYIELCSDENDEIAEPSYGDEDFYIKDIQIPIYKERDIEWLR